MTASWREVVRPTLRVARTGRADLIAGERAVQDVGKLVVGPARQVPENAAEGLTTCWAGSSCVKDRDRDRLATPNGSLCSESPGAWR